MILENIVIFRKIADVRQDLDLTQKKVADYLNVKQSTYSRWETGQEIIPLQKLYDFCRLTNCNMDYITSLSKTRGEIKGKFLDRKIIGQRIKEIRRELVLTQQELAMLLNTTQSTISAYESGRQLILTAFAYQIAKTANVSLDWLCGLSLIKNKDRISI